MKMFIVLIGFMFLACDGKHDTDSQVQFLKTEVDQRPVNLAFVSKKLPDTLPQTAQEYLKNLDDNNYDPTLQLIACHPSVKFHSKFNTIAALDGRNLFRSPSATIPHIQDFQGACAAVSERIVGLPSYESFREDALKRRPLHVYAREKKGFPGDDDDGAQAVASASKLLGGLSIFTLMSVNMLPTLKAAYQNKIWPRPAEPGIKSGLEFVVKPILLVSILTYLKHEVTHLKQLPYAIKVRFDLGVLEDYMKGVWGEAIKALYAADRSYAQAYLDALNPAQGHPDYLTAYKILNPFITQVSHRVEEDSTQQPPYTLQDVLTRWTGGETPNTLALYHAALRP